MKKFSGLIVVFGLLLFGNSSLVSADVITTECGQLPEGLRDAECTFSVKGPFSNSQSLNPGDSLFYSEQTITMNIPTPLIPGGLIHKMVSKGIYYFVGRTGEKTFELKYTYFSEATRRPIEVKNSYYFDTSVPFSELQISGSVSTCHPREMKIQVKLISLGAANSNVKSCCRNV